MGIHSLSTIKEWVGELTNQEITNPDLAEQLLEQILKARQNLSWEQLLTTESELRECVRKTHIMKLVLEYTEIQKEKIQPKAIFKKTKKLLKKINGYIETSFTTWDELKDYGITMKSITELVFKAEKKMISFLAEKAKKEIDSMCYILCSIL